MSLSCLKQGRLMKKFFRVMLLPSLDKGNDYVSHNYSKYAGLDANNTAELRGDSVPN